MSEDFLIKLVKVIDAKKKAKFKTNLDFATACEIDERTVRRILKGEQNFTIIVFQKICSGLNIKMSELLAEIEL